jgi:hypothetical protein
VHVFQDLHDLGQNNNSLNNFFQNLRNFNDLFDGCINRNFSLLYSIDQLHFSLDSVDNVVGLEDLGDLRNLFPDDLDWLLVNLGDCNLDDLLFDDWHLNENFLVESDWHDLLDNSFNDFVDPDELRNDGLELDHLNLLH